MSNLYRTIKISASEKGIPYGVATLGENGKLDASQLPASVDTIIEVVNYAALPDPGVSGTIYVTVDDGKIFRWSGTIYIEISPTSLVIGEESGTAFDGLSGATNTSNISINATSIETLIEDLITKAYVAKTANYTLTEDEYQIECTANSFTITLPTSVGFAGKKYSIKNTGTGTITIDGNLTETIDGELTQTIVQWENLIIMANGANWIIL